MLRHALAHRRLLERCAVASLLALLFALCLHGVRGKSLTTDEAKHWRYGMNLFEGRPERFDDSKMPISALNAVPRQLALAGWVPAFDRPLREKRNGRVVTMLFSLGTAALVWHWSRALYGAGAGLLALSLYVLDPNVIAHSGLMTTDVYAAGTILLACFAFWRLWQRPGWGRSFAVGAALGLALVAKYTAVLLYPVFAAVALARDAPRWRPLAARRDARGLARRLGFAARHAAVWAAAGLVVVNAAFLGDRTGTRLADYAFRSELFRGLAAAPALGALPVPTPYPFLEGLDLVRHRERTGESRGPNYLLGELRKPEGFAGYYLVASLFKLPLGTQAILALALVAAWRRRRDHRFLADELFLLAPIAFLALYFNFANRAQIGIRFFLPVFPLAYVLAGSLARDWAPFGRAKRVALGALLGWSAVSVLSYAPDHLAYMNELVWDRRQAWRVLADSNLDWGQDREWLQAWLAEHPEARFRPEGPVHGLVVVPASELVGVTAPPERYAWLRDHFEPVRTLRHSTLVYEIAPEDLVRVPHARPAR